jgi:hypothetical protein
MILNILEGLPVQSPGVETPPVTGFDGEQKA